MIRGQNVSFKKFIAAYIGDDTQQTDICSLRFKQTEFSDSAPLISTLPRKMKCLEFRDIGYMYDVEQSGTL